MIDANKLVDLLGHAYGSEQFKITLKELGIRNTSADNNFFYESEFI